MANAEDSFTFPRDERERERDAPAAWGKGDSSEGEHAEIKAAFQSVPCWPVRGLVAVSRHDNKHRCVQHVARWKTNTPQNTHREAATKERQVLLN